MVAGWKTIKIGDCLEFKNGLNKGKEFFGAGTPIVNYMDVYQHHALRADDILGKVDVNEAELSRFDVRRNDVFFTRTSETPEEVGYASVLLDDIPDCVFSGFVLRARPKNDLLWPAYCAYCFATPEVRNAIVRTCTYTTRALTNGPVLSDIEIPLPPLEEQKAIAGALDDIDNLITSLEALVMKHRDIKQGAMHDLLSGQRRLSGYQGEWRHVSLDDIALMSTATIYCDEINQQEYVGTDNMLPNKGGVVPNELSLNYASVKEYLPGDTLVSNIRPYLKKCWYANRRGGCSNDVIVFRSRDAKRIAPRYLNLVLSSEEFFAYAAENTAGTKMPRGDKNAIRRYRLSLPSNLAEQSAIAGVILDLDASIAALEKKLTKYRLIKQGMMEELLSGRIRLV